MIPSGTGLEGIASSLKRAGAIRHDVVFIIGARAVGKARGLKAGEYLIPASSSPRQIMHILESGKTVVRRLTIPEGLTSAEVMNRLDLAEGLAGTTALPPEGSLLPETYHFSYGDSARRLSHVCKLQWWRPFRLWEREHRTCRSGHGRSDNPCVHRRAGDRRSARARSCCGRLRESPQAGHAVAVGSDCCMESRLKVLAVRLLGRI